MHGEAGARRGWRSWCRDCACRACAACALMLCQATGTAAARPTRTLTVTASAARPGSSDTVAPSGRRSRPSVVRKRRPSGAEGHPCEAAGHRDDQRLGDQLCQHVPPPGANRLPDGELARPPGRPDEQQVHQVDEAHAEQERGSRLHQDEDGPYLGHMIRAQRHHARAEARCRHGGRLASAGLDHRIVRVHLRLRVCERDAGCKAREHLGLAAPMAAIGPALLGCRGEREKDARGRRQESKRRRQHADDRLRGAVDADPSPDRIRPAAEHGAPIPIADDRDVVRAERRLDLAECSPGGGPHAERVEELRRDEHQRFALGRARLAHHPAAPRGRRRRD